MTSETRDSAGVVIPPPLIYIAGFVLGYFVLHDRLPVPVVPSPVGRVLGWLFVAGWAALAVSAFLVFRRAGTSPIPMRPTTAIVTTGPYRFTRNPMYVSLALLYTGVSLLLNALGPLVLLPVVLLVVHFAVVAREERYLERKFGDVYRAYKARVRRWL